MLRYNSLFSKRPIKYVDLNFRHFSFINLNSKFHEISSKWTPDAKRELERLRDNSLVQQRLTTLENNQKKLNLKMHDISQKIAYGRALEIFSVLRETHYVFLHGQPGYNFLPLNALMNILNELNKQKTPEYQFITALRDLSHLTNIDPRVHTPDFYKKNINFQSNKTDHDYNNNLISADAYLLSSEVSESALYFFLNNCNRCNDILEKATNEILDFYIPNSEMKRDFYNDFTQIDRFFDALPEELYYLPSGTLYVICVDKSYFNKCGYLSTACGEALEKWIEYYPDLTNPHSQHAVIEQLQLESRVNQRLPQVRLLANKLVNTSQAGIVACSSMDYSYCHEKVYELVAGQYGHVFMNDQDNEIPSYAPTTPST